MEACVVIVAAGRGERAGGGLPKQFRQLNGRAVLSHTAERFETHDRISSIIVVSHPDHLDLCRRTVPNAKVVAGAQTRAGSVRAGLTAAPASATHVLIHDAARPCVSHDVIDRVLDALATSKGAAPALPVTDALWLTDNGQVARSVARDGLARAQTPQGFDLTAIRKAHETADPDAPDDVDVARAAGIEVAVVAGDITNIKITQAEDFARAQKIMETPMDIRTGTGFDVHRFVDGDGVILCGVHIAHTASLSGHSDADVAMHAITDAIYGALADGDIGQHFPPSDPKWKGAASDIFLRHAIERATQRGFAIANLDCTIICEFPKIGPHQLVMRENLAKITGVEADRISVKATTTETLGFTGRGEGIAAQASATLVSK